jgi:hypothetical protein
MFRAQQNAFDDLVGKFNYTTGAENRLRARLREGADIGNV